MSEHFAMAFGSSGRPLLRPVVATVRKMVPKAESHDVSDEERDDHGRFTSGGGEESEPSKEDVKWAKKVDEDRPSSWARTEEEKTKIKEDEKIIDQGYNDPKELLSKSDKEKYEENSDIKDIAEDDGVEGLITNSAQGAWKDHPVLGPIQKGYDEIGQKYEEKITGEESNKEQDEIYEKRDVEQSQYLQRERPKLVEVVRQAASDNRATDRQIKQETREAEYRQEERYHKAKEQAEKILIR